MSALIGISRIGILVTASVPLVWFVFSFDVSYRSAMLMMLAILGMSGLAGLATVGRGLANGRLKMAPIVGSIVLIGLVTAQTGWLLRPFVVTPGADLTFLCPVTSDVFGGIASRFGGRDMEVQDGAVWDCKPAGG